jgi:hypothetical protein
MNECLLLILQDKEVLFNFANKQQTEQKLEVWHHIQIQREVLYNGRDVSLQLLNLYKMKENKNILIINEVSCIDDNS